MREGGPLQHRFSRSRAAPVLVLFLIGIVGLRAAAGATTFHTIAPGGPPVTIAIASGDDAAVNFDGLTGQRVSLSLTGVTLGTSSCCSAKVSLLKPDVTTPGVEILAVRESMNHVVRIDPPDAPRRLVCMVLLFAVVLPAI